MSFRKIIWISSTCAFICIVALGLHLTGVKPQDAKYYKQLIDVSSNKKSLPSLSQSSNKQYSEKLSKAIWVSNQNQRQEILLLSDSADLDFVKQEGKIEIIENMKEVKIWVQEELFYTDKNGKKYSDPEETEESLSAYQQILVLESSKASYYWKTRLIVANKAHITRFISPSHELATGIESPDAIIMKGKAKLATLSFKNRKVHFDAKRLKAEFISKGP
ncbi:MAG: hypothetical protein GWP59_08255 [Chlamydiales bacterium]|nr:hypothetical protein [Chlamydiales bacterium]NCF71677.1 hypothetical protein [Chlamydiales bacterium]